jgi:hypothetical protein
MSINQHWIKPIKIKEIFSVNQTIRNKSFFQQLFSNIYGQELLGAGTPFSYLYIQKKSCETKRNSQEKGNRKGLTKDQTSYTGFTGFCRYNRNKQK